MKKRQSVVLFAAALTIVGLLGVAPFADATSNIRNLYDAAHGNAAGTTSCTFCHTSPPALNSTGATLLASANPPGSTNFDYCSIGPATGSCAVTVTAPVIGSFTATPASIAPGQSSTLSWTLSGGAPTTLSIDNGVGSVLGATSMSVSPIATTTYTLTASNSGGTTTRSVTVSVTSGVTIVWSGSVSFTAKTTTVETDGAGAQKFVTSNQSVSGTISLSFGSDSLMADNNGCYITFVGTDGTNVCIETVAFISTESTRSRSESALIIGSGTYTAIINGNPVAGTAYIDAKAALKEDASNNLLSMSLSGKIAGGVNSEAVFSGNFRATLTQM